MLRRCSASPSRPKDATSGLLRRDWEDSAEDGKCVTLRGNAFNLSIYLESSSFREYDRYKYESDVRPDSFHSAFVSKEYFIWEDRVVHNSLQNRQNRAACSAGQVHNVPKSRLVEKVQS